MRWDWESGFCLGMPNGERADFTLAPPVSLPEIAARATVDLRADLAAMAAAVDILQGFGTGVQELAAGVFLRF